MHSLVLHPCKHPCPQSPLKPAGHRFHRIAISKGGCRQSGLSLKIRLKRVQLIERKKPDGIPEYDRQRLQPGS